MGAAANKLGYVHLFLVFFHVVVSYSHGFEFPVGGRDGSWVPNPSENYNHWAERMRFQVNDTLLFKHRKGSESVAVVDKDEYGKCFTKKPTLEVGPDGNSVFKFNRSGPFFFISANRSHCINGQRLITVVLAVRSPPKPSPAGHPPRRSFAPPTCIPSLVWTALCFVGFIIVF